MTAKPAAPTVRDVRRRLLARLEDACRQLGDRTAPADVRVHEARKEIRSARALLRLLQPALGDEAFSAENTKLRDAGRALSGARDAKVMGETLAAFLARTGTSRPESARLHAMLAHDRTATSNAPSSKGSAPVRRMLADTGRSIRRRALPARADLALAEGLRLLYRRGRRAGSTARRAKSDAALHEWRKQSKTLRHALEVVEPLRPTRTRRQLEAVRKLAELLGRDHDAALLRSWLVEARVPATARARLLPSIDRQRRHWQRRAFALREEVYGARPRKAVRCVGLAPTA